MRYLGLVIFRLGLGPLMMAGPSFEEAPSDEKTAARTKVLAVDRSLTSGTYRK